MKPLVGFIGLGRMGQRMAGRLASAGFELVVADADASAVERLCATHDRARPAATRSDWHAAEILILMLPGSAAVESVLWRDEIAAALAPGALVIDMSSSEPMRTRALGSSLEASGLRFLDAPVTGGVRGAADGALSIIVGGASSDLEAARPLLEHLGSNIFHVGDAGSGHAAKALNNLVSAATIAITVEALRVGELFGVPAAVLNNVLNHGSGRSNTSERKVEQFMLSGTFDSGFTLSLMAKDATIGAGLGEALGERPVIGSEVARLWREVAAAVPPATDHTEMFTRITARAGDAGAIA